jgi:hypothetical protein
MAQPVRAVLQGLEDPRERENMVRLLSSYKDCTTVVHEALIGQRCDGLGLLHMVCQ